MGVKAKALKFAVKVHADKHRLDEPDIPVIAHPLRVGKILEELGYDDNIVAAGYLHDVIEDSYYTITVEDIRKEFGDDIAYLVETATESNPGEDWEIRKQGTVSRAKNLSLRNKAVICADKISNLEDFIIATAKKGYADFSNFKRDFDQYHWYYSSVYNSLILGEDPLNPLFRRLNNLIKKMFESKLEEENFKKLIFGNNLQDYATLRKFSGQRDEISKLNHIARIGKPYIIEVMGTPYTGKRTIIRNLSQYYSDANLKVLAVPSLKSSFEFIKKVNSSNENPSLLLVKESIRRLKELAEMDYDLIIMEKSIFNSIVVLNQLISETFSRDSYQDLFAELYELVKIYIDLVVITYTDYLTSLRRRYDERLAAPDQDFIISDSENSYNKSLLECYLTLDNFLFKDVTNESSKETSIEIANEVNRNLKNNYVSYLKKLPY